jgi:AAA ATPase domain
MLNYIHLENFRAFGEPTTIPLAPITLLFGENSAGKTSILHALTLLKQTMDADDRNAALVVRGSRALVDFGSFREFVFDHDLKRDVRLGFGGEFEKSFDPVAQTRRAVSKWTPSLMSSGSGGAQWRFSQAPKSHDIGLSEYAITDGLSPIPRATYSNAAQESGEEDPNVRLMTLSQLRIPDAETESMWRTIVPESKKIAEAATRALDGLTHENAPQLEPLRAARPSPNRAAELQKFIRDYDSGISLAAFRARLEAIWKGQSLRMSGLVPWIFGRSMVEESFEALVLKSLEPPSDEHARKVQAVLLAMSESATTANSKASRFVRTTLAKFVPIGPFRQPASRLYTYSGTAPRAVGHEGELVPDLIHQNPEVLEHTNEWLSRFETGYGLKLRSLGSKRSDVFELRLKDLRRRGGTDVSLSDVGFGISQVLPLVVQSVTSKSKIISIEQPEVHLHPRLQAEIGDLLVDTVKNNKHQFLIETHSEHLILRLRKLVREGKLKASDLCVVHVRRGKMGSIAERIRVNDDGSFADEWPGGFFPERIRELT